MIIILKIDLNLIKTDSLMNCNAVTQCFHSLLLFYFFKSFCFIIFSIDQKTYPNTSSILHQFQRTLILFNTGLYKKIMTIKYLNSHS